MSDACLRVAVGIATRNRPELIRQVVLALQTQSRIADRLVICHSAPTDIDSLPPGLAELVTAEPGLPCQRNRILDAVADCDVLVFFDDDFIPAADYLRVTCDAFAADPRIVASTGMPIADGARGPGYTVADAQRLIAADGGRDPAAPADIFDVPHGYGCNLAIRLATARDHGLRFDERLPLYGWSEDVDYTHRIGVHGRIVKLARARGVHLGVKSGRTSGRRLGYSQVANPVYLHRKGSYSFGRAWRSVGRNLAANLLHAPRPEPWIDRRGRLSGNLIAFADWMRGRMQPERVLDL